MDQEACRHREEEIIAACAEHVWRDSDASDFRKQGISTKEQLHDRIKEVVNHPDTQSFRCQPKIDREHPMQGEQFGREVHILREFNKERGRMENTVVILNENCKKSGEVVGGSAWVNSYDTELRRLLDREVEKSGLDRNPALVRGGRPTLQERERHQQLVASPSNRPPAFDPKYAREEIVTISRTSVRTEFRENQPPQVERKFAREEVGRSSTSNATPLTSGNCQKSHREKPSRQVEEDGRER